MMVSISMIATEIEGCCATASQDATNMHRSCKGVSVIGCHSVSGNYKDGIYIRDCEKS